ncbi:LuxR C-terminal-related transcriptional regulator [Nocardioides sp. LS1]|uniref:LuxR C-terminal-related transcriptional regulator n=1 Tax=Nocardioides sp. LS1 TaxID=1027620 RepID=UPI000F622A3A|nr:response regulator transcription factor [Nocardioides sp. LS1]GCD91347.1 DNA-binding response regulator [Nocardioides sp. LS1]
MPRSLGLTRVAIVEDHQLFAEALDVAMTLEGHDVHRVPITDHAVSTGHLLTQVLRMRPRVVLLDLDLGSTGNGTRLVEPLTQAGIAVVVVTASIDRARWGECLRYGARTVLPKSTPLNTILATIRLIGEGRPVLSREERDRLLAVYHHEKAKIQDLRDRLEQLTLREREVLAHLMAGRPVRDIAKLSFVSEATVRTQVKSILAKLDVTSQLAAVGAAHQASWSPPVLAEDR